MCASYTPPESVSLRSMVAPGYSASTAASTCDWTSPVRASSAGRSGRVSSADRLVGSSVPAVVSSAALAVSVPASTPPAIRPLATSPAAPP
jgi:hypothetical protein